MVVLESVERMFGIGPFDANDPPTPCAADGPVEPTGTVLEAAECDTARYVALAPVAVDVNRTYLILTREDHDDGTPLSFGDVTEVPEIQNALAHFGPQSESVRVLTHPGRRRPLSSTVDDLDERGNATFEYAGEGFRLDVRLG